MAVLNNLIGLFCLHMLFTGDDQEPNPWIPGRRPLTGAWLSLHHHPRHTRGSHTFIFTLIVYNMNYAYLPKTRDKKTFLEKIFYHWKFIEKRRKKNHYSNLNCMSSIIAFAVIFIQFLFRSRVRVFLVFQFSSSPPSRVGSAPTSGSGLLPAGTSSPRCPPQPPSTSSPRHQPRSDRCSRAQPQPLSDRCSRAQPFNSE